MSVSPMTLPRIELIYQDGCGQLVAARAAIRSALTVAGYPLVWQEWERDGAEAPAYARDWPSPTVLIGGLEVTGRAAPPADLPAARACCAFLPPAPPQIFAALTAVLPRH